MRPLLSAMAHCGLVMASVLLITGPRGFLKLPPHQYRAAFPSANGHMLQKHKPSDGLGAGHVVARGWAIDDVLLILRDHQP